MWYRVTTSLPAVNSTTLFSILTLTGTGSAAVTENANTRAAGSDRVRIGKVLGGRKAVLSGRAPGLSSSPLAVDTVSPFVLRQPRFRRFTRLTSPPHGRGLGPGFGPRTV